MLTIDQIRLKLLHNDTLRDLFTVRQSNTLGGKAGKGYNKTTSFSLSSEQLFFGRYFSYNVNNLDSQTEAIRKAWVWKKKILIRRNRCGICGEADCQSEHK